MSFFKTFFVLILFSNFAGGALFWFFGSAASLLNFELAVIGSLAILSSTYFGYKKMIEAKLNNEPNAVSSQNNAERTNSEHEDSEEDEEEQKISKASMVTQSYKGFLFPLRLLSYAVLAVSFIYLSNSGSLEIKAFLVGLAIAPANILIAMFFNKKEEMVA